MIHDPTRLPNDLPVPVDDGACDHLAGMRVPSVTLPGTDGSRVSLEQLPLSGPGVVRTVIYAYPRTGRPGVDLPTGWDAIPGARGCTPQSCSYRDHYRELRDLGAEVFGLSTQSTAYQREMVERLHLPFPVLSDQSCLLVDALALPTFEVDGMRLVKRLTLILREGYIEKLFYPVFPPDRSAEHVIAWLRDAEAA